MVLYFGRRRTSRYRGRALCHESGATQADQAPTSVEQLRFEASIALILGEPGSEGDVGSMREVATATYDTTVNCTSRGI